MGTATRGPHALRPKRATAVALIVVFVGLVLSDAIPAWLGTPEPVVRSSFSQRWNLFAPDPPSANLATFLLIRYADETGRHVTDPLDLSRTVRENSRTQRLAPPKLVRVVTKLNVAFEQHAYRDARLARSRGGIDQELAGEIRAMRERDVEAYRRMLSAAAINAVPADSRVLEVRGIVARTPVATFEDRGTIHAAAAPVVHDPDVAPALISSDVMADVARRLPPHPMLIFDSGWMSYVSDVPPMGVALR